MNAKRIAIVLALGLALASGTGATWQWLSPEVPSNDLNDVWGSGADHVVAVGTHGTILEFDGTRWNIRESGTTMFLEGVWGHGPDSVFAVGEHGTILHWDGHSWGPAPGAPSIVQDLHDVWAYGEDDCFVVGDEGLVYHCQDGIWSQELVGTGYDLTGIGGPGPEDLFIVGEEEVFLHYDGTDWSPADASTFSLSGAKVWSAGPGATYAVTNNPFGRLLHWNGWSWVIRAEWGAMWDYGIGGASDDAMFVTGNGGVYFYDGTSGYAIRGFEVGSTPQYFRSAWGASDDDIHIVGSRGALLHWNGEILDRFHIPRHGFNAVDGTGPQDVRVVGHWVDEGLFGMQTTWDGSDWTVDDSGLLRSICQDIDVMDNGHAIVAGWDFYHHDGSTWTEMPEENDLSPNSRNLWAFSDDFALEGSAYRSWIWDGTIWSPEYEDNAITSLWAWSTTEAYASTEEGIIMRWDGTGWTDWQTLTGHSLTEIWGTSPDNLYVVGPGGSIHHWNGLSWSPMSSGVTADLQGIAGSGPDEIYVVGDHGIILKGNGSSWQIEESGTHRNLTDVYVAGPGQAFVIGEFETVLTNDAGSVPPTPTPVPSGTPSTPTPTPEVGSSLFLNDDLFTPGEPFLLVLDGWNLSDQEYLTELWVILEVGGEFLFGSRPAEQLWSTSWPTWQADPAPPVEPLAQGQTFSDTILSFPWPPGVGSGGGLVFWSALLDAADQSLLGEIGRREFGYR